MKSEGIEYFLDKVCTVFTVPTNRDFKSENPQTFPQPIFHYFVGKVIEVSPKGICLEQWNSEKKLRTFFFTSHIVSISEEEVLDPSNPNDLQTIEEYKKTNESSMKRAQENVDSLKKSKYVDIHDLSAFAKK